MSTDGTFLRTTIHDLNNALTRIVALAELIASQTSDEQAGRDARDICDAALSARELVADLAQDAERRAEP
jgi:signal transduction histidine kinase